MFSFKKIYILRAIKKCMTFAKFENGLEVLSQNNVHIGNITLT